MYKPVASVPAGTYAVAQSVTLTAGVGETIYYTTDGTTPSATNGTVYTVPISLSVQLAHLEQSRLKQKAQTLML